MALPSTSCVALGTNFGVTFLPAPPSRSQLQVHALRGAGPELCAARGPAIRKVKPKFVPRATQDVEFPPEPAVGVAFREGEGGMLGRGG